MSLRLIIRGVIGFLRQIGIPGEVMDLKDVITYTKIMFSQTGTPRYSLCRLKQNHFQVKNNNRKKQNK